MGELHGHLFIINGDVTKLACDAWLLPTDAHFNVSGSFCEAVGMDRPGVLRGVDAWGERLVQPWPVSQETLGSGGPQIWLGNIGGTSATDLGHFADVASAFVAVAGNAAATQQAASRRSSDARLPHVALPVVGSDEGGKRSERGALLDRLVPALLDAAEANGVDVTLVAWGPVSYSAAQRARRRRTGDHWRGLSERLRGVAEGLADKARRGDLVVFMGAGVSAGAGVREWGDLLDGLADAIGYPEARLEDLHRLDLRDQATVLAGWAKDHDRSFRDALREELSVGRYSLEHGLIASLPITEAVTTNFDTLYETAASTGGRTISVLPGGSVKSGVPWLVKLHGALIGHDGPVLTREDYWRAAVTHSALFGVVQALLITRHMLFVGYSLVDEDFNNLINEVRAARTADNLFGTVLTLFPNEAFGELWSNDLNVVAMTEQPELTSGENTSLRASAARTIELFLDYLAAESASAIVFITSDAYDALRDEDEAELASAVHAVRRCYDRRGEDEVAWEPVRKFLDSFDAGGDN